MFNKTLVLLLVVLLSISFVVAKQHGDVKANKEAKQISVEEQAGETKTTEEGLLQQQPLADRVGQAQDDLLQEEDDEEEEQFEDNEEEEILDEDLAEEEEEEEIDEEEEEEEEIDEQEIDEQQEEIDDDEEIDDEEDLFEEEDEDDFFDDDDEEEEEGWEEFVEQEEVQQEDVKKAAKQNFDLAGLMQNTRTASNYETQAPPDPSLSRTPSFIPPTQSFTPIPFATQSSTPRGPPPPPASPSNTPGTASNSPAPASQSNTLFSASKTPVSASPTPLLSKTRSPRPSNSRSPAVPSKSKSPRKPIAANCLVIDNNDCNKYANCYWNVYFQQCLSKPKPH
jgi:chemotaxis protein histidine kinase CheA